jgi:hypothetical protein
LFERFFHHFVEQTIIVSCDALTGFDQVFSELIPSVDTPQFFRRIRAMMR